jgi:4'-phosphopantetheinyl transferase
VIQVWVHALQTLATPHSEAALSRAESTRACSLGCTRQRARYVKIHTWLHERVAEVLGVPADRVPLRIDGRGAPVLHGCAHQLGLSHHQDWIALAVSDREPVGVDILTVPPDADFVADTALVLSAEEIALVTSADRDHRGSVFATCWTRKEAYSKLLRTGLTDGLARLTLTPAADASTATSFWTTRCGDAMVTVAAIGAEPLELVLHRSDTRPGR